MELTETMLMLLGGLLYALAFALAGLERDGSRPWARVGLYVTMLGGFILQSVGLYYRGLSGEAFPVRNFFETLHVIAWSAIVVNLVIQAAFRVRFVHVLSTGLAGLLSLGAFVFDSEMPQRLATASGNPWVGFHAILAIFSYGIFAVLALTSLMYLLQHSALRRRHGGHLFSRMPAIGKLEEVNARLILTGVTLFSIGVGVGALNVLSADGTVGAIKLAIALGVWAIYLALLYLRQSQRLFGAPFAWACLCAFLLAMLTLQPLTVSTHPGADASAPVAPADNE